MAAQSEIQASNSAIVNPLVIREGIVSGVLGAACIAVWFLLVDSIQGRPFYTPSFLGTALSALLRGEAGIPPGQLVPLSFGMVLMYSIIHGATFIGVGIVGAWLLDVAERDTDYGLYVVFLLATGGLWFTFLSMVVAGAMLNALTIPDIFIAHLLAAASMGVFFWKGHPNLRS